MTSILLSVRPEWLAKILNGEKTVEIRKSVPKLPCEVYLYCTKKEYTLMVTRKGEMNMVGDILEKPEFIKMPETMRHFNSPLFYSAGKVVAKFTLKEADKITYAYMNDVTAGGEVLESGSVAYYITNGQLKSARLRYCDLMDYGNGKTLYAWHITNLVIFEKPMELWQFNQKGFPQSTDYVLYENNQARYYHHITRAPQSWMRVEVAK